MTPARQNWLIVNQASDLRSVGINAEGEFAKAHRQPIDDQQTTVQALTNPVISLITSVA